ncbi:hypothetical protein L596_030732 [Steinernema carpocapsae]|uniref:Uncharacterized protein n=1 Tax=Steinernema carpocapsae TaxID=34508 RepID=A0A4U5LNK9_STECR|nr:hypothetical protein L596_030732 [Steinernema carpocapsae]
MAQPETESYVLTISPDHQGGFHCKFLADSTCDEIMQKDPSKIRFEELILIDYPASIRKAKNTNLEDLKKLLLFVCSCMCDPTKLTIQRGNLGPLGFDEVLKILADVPKLKDFDISSFNLDVKNMLIGKLRSSKKLKSVKLDEVPDSMLDDFQSALTTSILKGKLFRCNWKYLQLHLSTIDKMAKIWRKSRGRIRFEVSGVLANSVDTTMLELTDHFAKLNCAVLTTYGVRIPKAIITFNENKIKIIKNVKRTEGQPPEGGRPEGGHPEGGHPEDARPEGGRLDGGRPEGGRPEGGHPESGHPEDARPDGGRPEGGRPEGGRPESGRPEGGRLDGGRPGGGRPEGGRPEGGRPESGRLDGGRPGGGRPEVVILKMLADGGRPEGGRPEGGRPESGRLDGGRPGGGRPEGGRPEGGRLDGGRPGGGRLKSVCAWPLALEREESCETQ